MYSLIENKQKRGRSWPIKNADGWIRTGVHRCWKQLAVFQFPINLPQSLFSISLFAPLSFYCTFVCLSVRSFYLFKHVPIPPSFCLVSSFPHHNSTINWKSVEVVDGIEPGAAEWLAQTDPLSYGKRELISTHGLVVIGGDSCFEGH